MFDALANTPDRREIRDAVRAICDQFDDDYWLEKDRTHSFPFEFAKAIADGGWLGIAMPEEYGGAGLGVTEAAIMMQEVGRSGRRFRGVLDHPHQHFRAAFDRQARHRRAEAQMAAGDHRRVVAHLFRRDRTGRRSRYDQDQDPRGAQGRPLHRQRSEDLDLTAQQADKIVLLARTTPIEECKKPTDGLTLFYTDIDRSKIEVREILKMGRHAVNSNQIFFDGLEVPVEHRIGEEGKGFRYILDSLNPERILNAAEVVGIGRRALDKAVNYAGERVVFGRPIGKNQSIQHPLAESWSEL